MQTGRQILPLCHISCQFISTIRRVFDDVLGKIHTCLLTGMHIAVALTSSLLPTRFHLELFRSVRYR